VPRTLEIFKHTGFFNKFDISNQNFDATAAFCHIVDPLEQKYARKLHITFDLLQEVQVTVLQCYFLSVINEICNALETSFQSANWHLTQSGQFVLNTSVIARGCRATKVATVRGGKWAKIVKITSCANSYCNSFMFVYDKNQALQQACTYRNNIWYLAASGCSSTLLVCLCSFILGPVHSKFGALVS